MSRRRITRAELARLEALEAHDTEADDIEAANRLHAGLDRTAERNAQQPPTPPTPATVARHEADATAIRAEVIDARRRLGDRATGQLPYPECSTTQAHRDAVLMADLDAIVSARVRAGIAEGLLDLERERLATADVVALDTDDTEYQ